MAANYAVQSSGLYISNTISSLRKAQISRASSFNNPTCEIPAENACKSSELDARKNKKIVSAATIPTMSEIMDSSRAQKLQLKLQTLGPFFRITVSSLETEKKLGRAEGFIKIWYGAGKILHLDNIRLRRETLDMEKSIFGIGLSVGAVAIRYGYDCDCKTAELLAINDSDLYHSKLVRFYTRMGFRAVHEVTGGSMQDLAHLLVWGGNGTRMDANVEELLLKWGRKFKPRSSSQR
ncbi:hypothetical protein C5167_037440 [Papaver somniferum]|uniref:Uncharacterized protein n=1 Tax=Papaver somniferum TaxID=3469 RepID=A0A4Y7I6C8_PAPSO|nr:uncharacterized protein LOC113287069 [Papaver somniferum]RZC44487.1 hypothetical protein C5167_037440 [Papaver somniferum]